MILFFIFIIWLLIGYGILRLKRIHEGLRFQESLAVEVETSKDSEFLVRWYYKVPMSLFYFIPLCIISITFVFLVSSSYFEHWFDHGLNLYVNIVLGIENNLSAAPLLRLFFYGVLLCMYFVSGSLIPYFITRFIEKGFPNYYKFQIRKENIAHSRLIVKRTRRDRVSGLLFIIIILACLYYFDFAIFLSTILVTIPLVFVVYFVQRFFKYVGLDSQSPDVYKNLLRSAFKQWLFLGGIVCAGLCISPIHVLTDKALVVSIFLRMKEINWSEVTSLDVKVEQNSSTGISKAGFDDDRYSVKAYAKNKEELEIWLFSSDDKSQLEGIVDIFKTKAIPIECRLDPNLETVLKGVDSSILGNSERRKFELLSYIRETCKK